jgi:Mor family transcriptional regulator
LRIYELHTSGITVSKLARRFRLSESRVWEICTAVHKFKANQAVL